MSLLSWLRNSKSSRSSKAHNCRLQVEALEDRMVLSTFYAATASDLIADIKTANLQGGTNKIVLTAPTTSPYVMSVVDNTTNGPNALPVIASGDNLTILTNNGSASPGFGDSISAGGRGRLFDVANGGSLTLENVTVGGGGPIGSVRAPSKGGAIYNQGTLVLSHVLVQNSIAQGFYSTDAQGGGIWSNGSLTVENSSEFLGNSAKAGVNIPGGLAGGYGGAIYIGAGTANIMGSTFGDLGFGENTAIGSNKAYGGAVYVGGGTVTMSGDTIGAPDLYSTGLVSNNVMVNQGGIGYGGGLCVAGGTVTLTNDTIINNWINAGFGGGIDIASSAQVYLDPFTNIHTQNNQTGSAPFKGPSNIFGLYTSLAQSSLTANANPITAGSSLTLTATNLAPATPGTTITQVSFFYFDNNGAKHVLGNRTQTSTGVWTLTVKANQAPGAYTLYAQAEDSSGLFSDPVALKLTVQ
jgi:hypothetical protein